MQIKLELTLELPSTYSEELDFLEQCLDPAIADVIIHSNYVGDSVGKVLDTRIVQVIK